VEGNIAGTARGGPNAEPTSPSRTGRRPLLLILAVAGVLAIVGAVMLAVLLLRGQSPYRVTATVPIGRMPHAVAVDPDTHTVYVVNSGDRTLSVIEVR